MQYVKTLKKFVAGSDKFFDVFTCTVDEVDEVLDSKGRRQIEIKVGDQTFKGMYNKKVLDFLLAHEGESSFIVLWKSNKSNYLISYAWELWDAYDRSLTDYDSCITQNKKKETGKSREAFIYMWINLEDDRKYIGTHKGDSEDGYICSNERLLAEYNAAPYMFRRTILAYGTQSEMLELETILLIQLSCATGDDWYNLSNNLRK
jgi:hypothetical protein